MEKFLCIYVFSFCFVCLSVCTSVHLSIHPSLCLYLCLSICLFVYTSVHLSVCLFVHLSVCPSVHLYVIHISLDHWSIFITLLELLICLNCFLFSADLWLNCEIFHDIDTELVLVEDPIRIQDVKLETRGGGTELKLIMTSVNCLII